MVHTFASNFVFSSQIK